MSPRIAKSGLVRFLLGLMLVTAREGLHRFTILIASECSNLVINRPMQVVKLTIDFLKMVPADEYPNIHAWYAEVGKRPAAAKAYEE